LNGRIIGVAAFGNLPSFGGYDTSVTYSAGLSNLLVPTTRNWVADSLIPEPGTLGLLASGLSGLILFGRRRRRL
jgi:hypothetical protein